jgi:hypothetical protein
LKVREAPDAKLAGEVLEFAIGCDFAALDQLVGAMEIEQADTM